MTIDNLIDWLQEAEDNNSWMVSTQSVKRHLEKIKETELLIIDSVMHCNGVSKDVVLDNENDLEEHGCPYQEEINGDYDFKCNCNEEDTHQCAMDI